MKTTIKERAALMLTLLELNPELALRRLGRMFRTPIEGEEARRAGYWNEHGRDPGLCGCSRVALCPDLRRCSRKSGSGWDDTSDGEHMRELKKVMRRLADAK
jgi:hypothetical protein